MHSVAHLRLGRLLGDLTSIIKFRQTWKLPLLSELSFFIHLKQFKHYRDTENIFIWIMLSGFVSTISRC